MNGSVTKSLSSTSMQHLIARLDRLDSLTKYLEEKSHSSRWASDHGEGGVVRKELVPLDLAVKEAKLKGSLLDRIAALEDRLIQLCLDNESGTASSSKSSGTEQSSPATTSPRRSEKGSSYSVSRFRKSRYGQMQASEVFMDKLPVTENKEQHMNPKHIDEASPVKKSRDDKASPKLKKEKHSGWPRMRLLGCN